MKASELLGRTARDTDGRPLGRVADLITTTGSDGSQYIYAVLVTPRHRGRLFGYERPGMHGPWLIEHLTWWLHRGTREIPWSEVRVDLGTNPA
jgi:sporulation protein YlmC with PRC-barrel domain